jgi:hypothetical protein
MKINQATQAALNYYKTDRPLKVYLGESKDVIDAYQITLNGLDSIKLDASLIFLLDGFDFDNDILEEFEKLLKSEN